MNEKLKPCPFCGCDAVLTQASIDNIAGNETNTYKCGCPVCDIFFYGETVFDIAKIMNGSITHTATHDGMKEAMEMWNRRVGE